MKNAKIIPWSLVQVLSLPLFCLSVSNPQSNFGWRNTIHLNINPIDSYGVLTNREKQIPGITLIRELMLHLGDGVYLL